MTSALKTSPAESDWLSEAVADLERLQAAASPALRAELGRFLGRLGTMNGGSSLADALRRPASTPFVPLIDAGAADLGLAGDPRVGLLGRSAVLLYAYVRLQDDLVDEPDLVPREAVFAAEALLGAHLSLFAAAVPDPRAFALREAIMLRFAGIAAEEVEGWRSGGSDSAAWIGGKGLPMAVPLAGMAVLAERPELAGVFERFIAEAGTGIQLVNDLFNAPEDALGSRPTPVLRWLQDEVGALDASAPVRALLLSESSAVTRRALDLARDHVEAARTLAEEAGLHHTAGIARLARGMVDAAPRRLLRLMLGMPVT